MIHWVKIYGAVCLSLFEIELWIPKFRLFIDSARLDASLRTYLLSAGIKTDNYEDIIKVVGELSAQNYKIWVSPFSSYAIYNAVTDKVS